MIVKLNMRVKLRQINRATGQVQSETPFQSNLVMDGGLNALARSTNATNPAGCFAACRVGDGSTSDKTASGAITFTQVGTTLTASAPFFTAPMVGQLFKWGSGAGGNERYITVFTDSQNVTLDTSETVAVPAVGVVWNVSRTTLENLLYSSATYETTGSSCSTACSGAVATHQRTFNFAQQVSSYNVNEVGYFTGTGGTTIFGRLVLGSTEVISPTNFLQVVLQLVVTYTPSSPTAVGDVGTNIDTSGNAMLENLVSAGSNRNIAEIQSNGATSVAGTSGAIDGSASGAIRGIIATYTQNGSTLQTQTPAITSLLFQANLTWTYNSVRGQMRVAANTTISTAGQTLFGVCLYNTNSAVGIFDVKFTTTPTLPTGSYLPQVTFLLTYNRLLNN